MRIINANSYRILGAFSSATKKELVSNKSKFNAFLRVDQPVPDQKYDLLNVLPPVNRSLDSINKAESELTVSKKKMMQNLFWFVCSNETDVACMDMLTTGNFAEAIQLWKKEGTVTSLQNIMLCHLVNYNYREALIAASNIISVHFKQWLEFFSFLPEITSDELAHLFLDELCLELQDNLLELDWEGLPEEWFEYVKNKIITPVIDEITYCVDESRKSRVVENTNQMNTIQKLKDKTSPLLKKLELVLDVEDASLQSYEDMVVNELLNGCIDSYNYAYHELEHSNEDPYRSIVPQCATVLDGYNQAFMSQMVANRYKENKVFFDERDVDIDKSVSECIAFNENICWFCGESGEAEGHQEKYSMTISTPHFGYTENTTYSKIITIFRCKKCEKEFKERKRWKFITALLVFPILYLPMLFIVDTDFETTQWVFVIALLVGISVLLGQLFGKQVRRLLDKSNIREIKREYQDHPLVKQVTSEGYSKGSSKGSSIKGLGTIIWLIIIAISIIISLF